MTRKGALRVGDYLGHMLDAIRQIERYVEGLSEADFLEDRKTQDAVIRNSRYWVKRPEMWRVPLRNSRRRMPRCLGVMHIACGIKLRMAISALT